MKFIFEVVLPVFSAVILVLVGLIVIMIHMSNVSIIFINILSNLAKSMDQFCPLGPAITTTDVISDPHNLIISCSVNGVEKQKANTNELIHRVDKLISFLSE